MKFWVDKQHIELKGMPSKRLKISSQGPSDKLWQEVAQIFLIQVSEGVRNFPTDLVQLSTMDHNVADLNKLSQGSPSSTGFTLDNGLLKRGGKIVVGPDESLRKKLIDWQHSSLEAGHSDRDQTLKRLKGIFYWKGLARDVTHFVRYCTTCQSSKYDTAGRPGTLQPLWSDISMDFITGLPTFMGQNVVYNQPPPLHLPYLPGESSNAVMDRSLQRKEEMLAVLKSNLHKAQERMKVQADKRRLERSFAINDWLKAFRGSLPLVAILPDIKDSIPSLLKPFAILDTKFMGQSQSLESLQEWPQPWIWYDGADAGASTLGNGVNINGAGAGDGNAGIKDSSLQHVWFAQQVVQGQRSRWSQYKGANAGVGIGSSKIGDGGSVGKGSETMKGSS
uniref:Integrase zinc-binding domain-containing protein n=1 Tax=Chenopodium quinoa TaxID=63459 RepID=A0A803MQL8_CHEQI